MLLPSKPTVFFGEDTINLDIWRLKKIANAAHSLLPSSPGHHIFVKLDDHVDNRFLVMHGCTPNIPLKLWQATVVDEDEEPRLKWMVVKE
ncbi:MAG TPA: hypothetical protein VMW72_18065 [Sedimentisphaerales bacterium]|nr:hypothetical protein [Sedimentisphaerales bacterium]